MNLNLYEKKGNHNWNIIPLQVQSLYGGSECYSKGMKPMSDECLRQEPWQIRCRVISQEGDCAAGHKVGDEIIFTGEEVKGKICLSALYSMMPKVYAMTYNARFPWLEDQCSATHACPDGFNPVIFELTRIDRE